jgi:hypothetical protein
VIVRANSKWAILAAILCLLSAILVWDDLRLRKELQDAVVVASEKAKEAQEFNEQLQKELEELKKKR